MNRVNNDCPACTTGRSDRAASGVRAEQAGVGDVCGRDLALAGGGGREEGRPGALGRRGHHNDAQRLGLAGMCVLNDRQRVGFTLAAGRIVRSAAHRRGFARVESSVSWCLYPCARMSITSHFFYSTD